jgi:hypothetical protein
MFSDFVDRDLVLLGAGLNKVARQPRKAMERSYAHCPHTLQNRQPSGSCVDAGTCVSIPTFFFTWSYHTQHCSPLRVRFELERCRLQIAPVKAGSVRWGTIRRGPVLLGAAVVSSWADGSGKTHLVARNRRPSRERNKSVRVLIRAWTRPRLERAKRLDPVLGREAGQGRN